MQRHVSEFVVQVENIQKAWKKENRLDLWHPCDNFLSITGKQRQSKLVSDNLNVWFSGRSSHQYH